jgi:endonuclease YncB( thermonuclease family)
MPRWVRSLALVLTLCVGAPTAAQSPQPSAIAAAHIYAADVLSVSDGDSFHARVALGLEVERRINVRVFGLFAPEKSTAQGKAVRAAAMLLIAEHGNKVLLRPRILSSGREDKSFDRLVCEVWFETGERYGDALKKRITWTDNGIGGGKR